METKEEIVKKEVKEVQKALRKDTALGIARALRLMLVVSTLGLVVRRILRN